MESKLILLNQIFFPTTVSIDSGRNQQSHLDDNFKNYSNSRDGDFNEFYPQIKENCGEILVPINMIKENIVKSRKPYLKIKNKDQ